jgi:hypothetical protein
MTQLRQLVTSHLKLEGFRVVGAGGGEASRDGIVEDEGPTHMLVLLRTNRTLGLQQLSQHPSYDLQDRVDEVEC